MRRALPFALVAPLLAGLLAGRARGDAYQPGTQPRTWPAALVPAGDNQLPVTPVVAGTSVGGLQLERAAYCVYCHATTSGGDWPGNQWKGTMMANAGRDPLFWAALAIANQDSSPGNPLPGDPDYVGGDYCLRCHAPAGFLDGHTQLNPPPHVGGQATAADPDNPSRYPCNSYDVGAMATCRCLASDGDCTATPANRDFCAETPERVANGYCLVDFENPAARLHPLSNAEHAEADEQLISNGAGETADVYDDTEGVQCALCHRLDPGANASRHFGGAYLLSTAAGSSASWLSPRAVRYGPWATPGLVSGGEHPHPGQQSALHASSALCGNCHDVTNPVLDRLLTDGSDAGYKMPIERTFSEWAASDFRDGGSLAQTCQGCHMPTVSGSEPVCFDYDSGSSGLSHSDSKQHVFAGGNVWIPSVLRDLQGPDAGGTDPAWMVALVNASTAGYTEYDATQAAAQAMLASAATLARQDAAAAATAGEPFAFTLRVTNHSGHKLPTGYPEGRRMWLQVAVTAGGTQLLDSGDYDGDSGLLTRDEQLKIYEIELGVAGSQPSTYPQSFHFVRNQIVYSDNRIPPSGFDPTAGNFAEMAPVPASLYPPTANGTLPNWDDTSYTVAVPAGTTGALTVTAQLVYQTASKDYVDFLDDENTSNGRGDDLATVWRNHGRSPIVVMATTSFSVPVLAGAPLDLGAGGGGEGAGGGGGDLGAVDAALPSDLGATPAGDLASASDLGAGDLASVDLSPPGDPGRTGASGCSCDLGGGRPRRPSPSTVMLALTTLLLLLRRRLL